MIPCINQVTTLSTAFEADIPVYAQCGWTAVEIWLTKLETFLQERPIDDARRLLDEHGMTAPAASSQGGLVLSLGPERAAHWDHFRRRLGWLKSLDVPTLVISPDFLAEPTPEALDRAMKNLAEAAETAGGFGVRLALEFQKSARFCASLDTTAAVVTQVGHPNLGICLDLFHYYTGPSKFEDLAYLSRENLAWVQVCDLSGTPREVAGDADRILPGEGDFQIDPIFEHLSRLGYDGGVSVEVLNPRLWQISADRVADAAYRAVSRLRLHPREAEASNGGA